jgi:hypothetical protein
VDFLLPDETEEYRRELARWTDRRQICPGFHPEEWQDFVRRGLLTTQQDESITDTAVAFMEVSRQGLPGPLLNTRLAADASADAYRLAAEGRVIATVPRGPGGWAPVGWGAVANMVADQAGAILARGPLPRMSTSYLHPHGWWHGQAALPGGDAVRAWVLGGALLSGLTTGMLELTTRYVGQRVQFGRPIGSFQAVQFPLAQCKVMAEGLRLMVLDAAWRAASGRIDADVAAALLCVSATRVSRFVADACHQAYGATGLANESGLNELTWGARWLRHEMDVTGARTLLDARRDTTPLPPPSLVLQGFR